GVEGPDLPSDNLAVGQEIEQLPGRGVGGESRERLEPDFHPAPDREALGDARDDDGAEPDLDAFELRVLRQEDQVAVDCEPVFDGRVGQPTLARRDDVLGLEPGPNQASMELEREVLVEQEPQEASLTAGGVWAARWAAYRSAATTCARVSW